jgi:sugar O-acyltransferase (sialic acid O-acetyltransferase NeuD family)
MRKPLFIYGAGGLGREVLALVRRLEEWEPRGFFDDGLRKSTIIRGIPVIGGMEEIKRMDSIDIVIAIGSPLLKQGIAAKMDGKVRFPFLIDPKATVLDPGSVHISEGSIICSGAVLTTDIFVGTHVLINLNATVGHDTSIGSFSSVMPGVNIAGEVKIGEGVLLGSGCNIMNRRSVGRNAQVGMGAVVLKNVGDGETVVGVPAKAKINSI